MQATKVTLGGEYAVQYERKLARFRVTEQITRKNSGGTTNMFKGTINFDDGKTKEVEATFEAKDILDEFTEYKELVAAKKAEQDRVNAENLAKAAKKRAAVDALNSFLGFEAIDWKRLESRSGDYRYEHTLPVKPSYSGIEIREEAYDVLLARLSPEWKEPANG